MKTSHDALYSVIDLDRELASLSNKILIESSTYASTVFIYVFYGKDRYQFIKFEPENLLTQTDLNSGELLLPKDKSTMNFYPDVNVSLILQPTYDHTNFTQNTTVELAVRCRNYGLKIERTQDETHDELYYSNKEGKVLISLLDYFDGFNSNYSINYHNEDQNDSVFESKITGDKADTYLVESVSSQQQIVATYSIDDILLIFYQQNFLLEAYSYENGVKRISDWEINDYYDLFEG